MNENQTYQPPKLPTRKQKALLDYIEAFIKENGYSPSYREIADGMNYASVATVAIHIDNLAKRGLLIKRGKYARSIELADGKNPSQISSNQIKPNEEKWLIEKVEHAFKEAENEVSNLAESSVDNLYVLVGALKVLGLEGAANSFMPRLSALKQRLQAT